MSVVVMLLNIILIIVIISAVGIILWRVISERRFPVSVCFFLIMPISQLLMLQSFSLDEWSLFWLFGLLFGVAANFLLMTYTISQERKTTAIEELREIRHRIELEKSHYEAIEQRRGELDTIRKDFNEKLETIAGIARSGADEEARGEISAFAESINRTRENHYCAVPVINAVLSQKENECKEAGIVLSVDLNLPDILDVEPMHLCSILSNILDNAIAACQKVKSADKPIIRITSQISGDYLIIKAVNPSIEPKKSAPGRGYGLKIISELTKNYGGDFQSDYSDGVFSVLVSLLTVER